MVSRRALHSSGNCICPAVAYSVAMGMANGARSAARSMVLSFTTMSVLSPPWPHSSHAYVQHDRVNCFHLATATVML